MNSLNRFAPPGMEVSNWKNFIFSALAVSTILSVFAFGNRLMTARTALFDPVTGKLLQPVTGWSFGSVLDRSMLGFALFAIGMTVFVLLNYLYFFEGSKSIYTMARVKSPWELHFRCWTLPACGAAVLLLSRVILTVLYFLIFLLATPKGVPMPGFYQLIGGLLQ